MIDLYLKRGWSVVPLRPNDKRPAMEWAQWAKRQPTAEETSTWSKNGGLGIVTGAVSKLAVVDIDSQEGLDWYGTKGLSTGLSVKTRKGLHIYYQYPEDGIGNSVKKWPGIDIRGDGGFVVAPPTVIDGHRYTWRGNFRGALPPLPSVFLQPYVGPAGDTSLSQTASELGTAGAINSPGWIASAFSGLAVGNRYDTLSRVVGKLVRDRWDEASIVALLTPTLERFKAEGVDRDPFVVTHELVLSFQRKDAAKGVVSAPHTVSVGDKASSVSIESLDEYEATLARRALFKEPELPTGFRCIDEKIDGFHRGDVMAVGAWTGGGKSTWFVNAMNALCRQGRKVLLFSTEMGRLQIYDKFFALNTGIDYMRFRKGDLRPHELSMKDRFKSEFKDYPLVIDASTRPSAEQIRAMTMREKPDVVVLDHIHQVSSDYRVLSELSKAIKDVATDFDCATAIAAQFSRPARVMDAKTGELKLARKPTVYDFKGCGDIENIMDTAILLYDTGESLLPDVNAMNADVAKCRHGEKGIVGLSWFWKTSKMEDRT